MDYTDADGTDMVHKLNKDYHRSRKTVVLKVWLKNFFSHIPNGFSIIIKIKMYFTFLYSESNIKTGG